MKCCWKILLSASLILIWNSFAIAQIINGTICDYNTKLPVSDINVYLDGTSIGTKTDLQGRFTLTVRSAINTKLVISHITYQPTIIDNPFDGVPDTLYIKEKVTVLNEIVITPDGFSRTQKIKAFREQFLGMSKAAKSCVILNEDDIQFTINQLTGKFSASSEKPIEVVNNFLGYQIAFLLIDFWVEYPKNTPSLDNDWVRRSFFAVHSVFTDLKPNSKSFKKRRDNVYELSSDYFFKSMANDFLVENKFVMFNKALPIEYKQYFSIKDTSHFKMISIIEDEDMDVSSLSRQRIDKGEKSFYSGPKLSGKFSVLYDKKNQSDIYFLTDSFLVDRYGNVNPSDQIVFTGQFGENRAGDMLPLDYEFAMIETKRMRLTFQNLETQKIYLTGKGKISIDWGDGSAIKSHSLSTYNNKDWENLSSKYKYSHKYSKPNTYTITISGLDITHLACISGQLTSIDISDNDELQGLLVPNNQLSYLDLSNNVKLKELACFGNPLPTLDLKNNTALKKIMCGGNLSSIDLSKCAELLSLHISKNPLLTELDLSKCNSIQILDCPSNALTTLDLSQNDSLLTLVCENNQLMSLILNNNNKLFALRCGDNQLSNNALNYLFELLPNYNDSRNRVIVFNNNPGTNTCNQNIAKEKGWLTFPTMDAFKDMIKQGEKR
jgi:hypothetical protein